MGRKVGEWGGVEIPGCFGKITLMCHFTASLGSRTLKLDFLPDTYLGSVMLGMQQSSKQTEIWTPEQEKCGHTRSMLQVEDKSMASPSVISAISYDHLLLAV